MAKPVELGGQRQHRRRGITILGAILR
ncbi:MAG: hypothetical protein QOI01_2698, partial [Mycobacterium sp.]|nr:hypothetical protein [Mycobacterium sp.]